MAFINHNNAADVIGHHYVAINHHVPVVAGKGFHFGISNDSRFREHYLSVDTSAEGCISCP